MERSGKVADLRRNETDKVITHIQKPQANNIANDKRNIVEAGNKGEN